MYFFNKNLIFLLFLFICEVTIANDIDNQIKNYILKNPEIIIESLKNYEKKKEDEKKVENKNKIENLKLQIFETNNKLYQGNLSSEKVIVEFFDYNCSYCKRAHNDIKKLLDQNKNIKIIYKNFPILSDNSVKLAKYALILSEIDNEKFKKFHNWAIRFKGNIKDKDIDNFLKKENIIKSSIDKRLNDSNIQSKLEKDVQLANSLNLRGTPAFIIGNEIIFGYIDYDEMISKINQQ